MQPVRSVRSAKVAHPTEGVDVTETTQHGAEASPAVFSSAAGELGVADEFSEVLGSMKARAERRSNQETTGAKESEAPFGDGEFVSFATKSKGGADAQFDSGEDSIDSEEPTRDNFRRERRLARHFDGFDDASDEDDNFSDVSDMSDVSSNISNASVASRGSSVGADVADAQEDAPVDPGVQRREQFRGAVYETRASPLGSGEAALTLMSITNPISIKGPCAVAGVSGEVVVGGALIGRGIMLLHSMSERASVFPTKKMGVAKDSIVSEEQAVEKVGAIAWGWVEGKLVEWRQRCAGSMPAMVLIAQNTKDAANETWDRAREERSRKTVRKELPSFFSKYTVPTINRSLLPSVIPKVVSSRCAVAVIGPQNIGKSTLCRFLTNAFVSVYGECWWLDIDLGQPEFTTSGCMSLCRITAPLLKNHSTFGVEIRERVFLGSSRVRCPVLTARAIEYLTDRAAERDGAPLVINTHGWVHSSGRRTTIETVRRVKPKHVIHLSPQQRDVEATSWLTSESVSDATQGLNASVVANRFRLPFAAAMPSVSAGGAASPTTDKNDSDFPSANTKEKHSIQVHHVLTDTRAFRKKDSHSTRKQRWSKYFRLAAGHDAPLNTIPLAAATRVLVVDEIANPNAGALLAGALVALVKIDEAAVPEASLSQLRDVPVMSCVGFGIVSSSEHKIANAGAKTLCEILTPIATEALRRSGANAVVVSRDQHDTEGLTAALLAAYSHTE